MKKNFQQAYKEIEYVLRHAKRVLLFAHTSPDPDTLGANIALKEYLLDCGVEVDIICFDEFPKYLKKLFPFAEMKLPSQVDVKSYDVVIACDSVDRGFHLVREQCREEQVVVLIDHHPEIQVKGDIAVIDAEYSSSCELVFDLFEFMRVPLSPPLTTALLMGIMADTGNFQHSTTTSRVLEIASKLVHAGAALKHVAETLFGNKNTAVLKLWGKAFVRAKVNPESKMIVSVLTYEDIREYQPSMDDIKYVAALLNTVSQTRFSLLFAQLNENTIKGSLRSEPYKGVDVSVIAKQFGGGGHRLSSGFEVRGRLQETSFGWEIV